MVTSSLLDDLTYMLTNIKLLNLWNKKRSIIPTECDFDRWDLELTSPSPEYIGINPGTTKDLHIRERKFEKFIEP